MKDKLTNFGVYIVKKLFFPVYDKIYDDAYSQGCDHTKQMIEAAQDDIIMGPEEPDMYDVLYKKDMDDDYDEFDDGPGWIAYDGPDTQADFYKWRAEAYPTDEANEFLNQWMETDIDHNVWIGNVSLAEPSRYTSGTWEIYSRSVLFEDCERYTDKVSALLRIYWLQNVWMKEVKA